MIKLGILGNGKILNEIIPEIEMTNRYEIVVGGVRNPEKTTFFEEKGIPAVVGYENVINNPEVEVVYVVLINSLHYEYAKMALEAKKHVILEKPLVSSLSQAKELFEIAEKNNVYLFEAMTLHHNPNYKRIKEYKDEIKLINIVIAQKSSRLQNLRKGIIDNVFNPKLEGGAMRDLGVYAINFIYGLVGYTDSVEYIPQVHENGIDLGGQIIFKYDDKSAVVTLSKVMGTHYHITILGDDLLIKSDDMVSTLYDVEINGENFKSEGVYRYEFEYFYQMLTDFDDAKYLYHKEMSLKEVKVLEDVYKNLEI